MNWLKGRGGGDFTTEYKIIYAIIKLPIASFRAIMKRFSRKRDSTAR